MILKDSGYNASTKYSAEEKDNRAIEADNPPQVARTIQSRPRSLATYHYQVTTTQMQ